MAIPDLGMAMAQDLEQIIQQYEKHLARGVHNLQEFEHSGRIGLVEYKIQKIIVRIWKMVLKNLRSLSDTTRDDHTKKDY